MFRPFPIINDMLPLILFWKINIRCSVDSSIKNCTDDTDEIKTWKIPGSTVKNGIMM